MSDETSWPVRPPRDDSGSYAADHGELSQPTSHGAGPSSTMSDESEGVREIEVTIKVKMALPAEWEKPQLSYRGPLSDFWRDQVYNIIEKWRPRTRIWVDDWQHHLEGRVTDVEIDAGEWGYDCLNEEDDDRLRIVMVMVPK